MIRRSGLFCCLAAALASIVTIYARDCPAQYTSTHHVREAIRNNQATPIGRLPPSQVMQLDIVLQLRDPEGLKSFLEELYDPNSGIYHQYLRPKEFTERFGPSEQDYDDVLRFAKANGLAVVGGSRDGMDVQV
jgi:subtilase family serine protease